MSSDRDVLCSMTLMCFLLELASDCSTPRRTMGGGLNKWGGGGDKTDQCRNNWSC